MSIDKHLEPQTRQLSSVLEPVAAQVSFAAECHQAYEKLGFSASPGVLDNGVQLPDAAAYFTSRGSVMGMGQVPGSWWRPRSPCSIPRPSVAASAAAGT
jgi:hypothetical protein